MTSPAERGGLGRTPVTDNIIRARLAQVICTRDIDDYHRLLVDFGETPVWISDPDPDGFPLSRHQIGDSRIDVGSGPNFGRLFFRVAAEHPNNTLGRPQEIDVTEKTLAMISLNTI